MQEDCERETTLFYVINSFPSDSILSSLSSFLTLSLFILATVGQSCRHCLGMRACVPALWTHTRITTLSLRPLSKWPDMHSFFPPKTLGHTHSADAPLPLEMYRRGVEKSSTVEHSWLNRSVQTASVTPISFGRAACHSKATQAARKKREENAFMPYPDFFPSPLHFLNKPLTLGGEGRGGGERRESRGGRLRNTDPIKCPCEERDRLKTP